MNGPNPNKVPVKASFFVSDDHSTVVVMLPNKAVLITKSGGVLDVVVKEGGHTYTYKTVPEDLYIYLERLHDLIIQWLWPRRDVYIDGERVPPSEIRYFDGTIWLRPADIAMLNRL